MGSTLTLLRRLQTEKVEFVVVGGFAAIAHGSAAATVDVDVCVRFDLPTMQGVFRALAGTNPKQRMSPARHPLGDDPARFVGYRNLYVVCDDGVIDFLGSVTGVGDYAALTLHAVSLELDGTAFQVMGLDDLIASKTAMGRPKDQRVVRELELVRERAKR